MDKSISYYMEEGKQVLKQAKEDENGSIISIPEDQFCILNFSAQSPSPGLFV